LRQTLLSRPNLEQVLHLSQLDIGKTQAEKDVLIAALGTQVQVRATAQAKNLFTISYTNTDPVVAKEPRLVTAREVNAFLREIAGVA
jgi:hypothetical protein